MLARATSGKTPPKRRCSSICVATTLETIVRPSTTTAAAVSSQLVSIARILVIVVYSVHSSYDQKSINQRAKKPLSLAALWAAGPLAHTSTASPSAPKMINATSLVAALIDQQRQRTKGGTKGPIAIDNCALVQAVVEQAEMQMVTSPLPAQRRAASDSRLAMPRREWASPRQRPRLPNARQ